jgi:predicted nucleic acid-binding protein
LNSLLVDTSFLISLADPTKALHATARDYFKAALQNSVPIYLSSIVASEFHVKQPVSDLGLRNFIVLPFNFDHALRCGDIMKHIARDSGDDRVAVKDDIKLIAQCSCDEISHLVTSDEKTLAKYLNRLNVLKVVSTKVILLSHGFDESWFHNGQSQLLSKVT